MIIKNISPYPKILKDLGNKHLMPGEEYDLSNFGQKERDNCYELQESFRKGELICIGMGQQESIEASARLRIARARVLQDNPQQPLIEVQRGRRVSSNIIPSKLNEVSGSLNDGEEQQKSPVLGNFHNKNMPRRPVVKTFDKPLGAIEKDQHGAVIVRPSSSSSKVEVSPVDLIGLSKPSTSSITPDRIREIWSLKCISFRTNGQKCKRWAAKNSQYCINHMPAEEKERRKKEKRQQFFGD